jgi:hypothetical protein
MKARGSKRHMHSSSGSRQLTSHLLKMTIFSTYLNRVNELKMTPSTPTPKEPSF